MPAALRSVPPPATPLYRAWYAWSQAAGAVFSATMGPLLVLHARFRPTARTMRRWMRPWARFVTAAAGVRVELVERGARPEGPVVYVANHVSALDIPATMLRLPSPFLFVARHEVGEWPFVGWVLRNTPSEFIRRDDPRQAVRDLNRIADVVREGTSVLLFPEGERSHRHEMAPFMKGPFVLAIEAGVPIVPVALVGHPGVLSKETRTARPGRTRVVVGPPIPTEGCTRRDAADLMARTRAAIEAELAAAA